MNGLIVLSLDSGLLLYATKQLGAFGFNQSASQNIDAMQLSSTIFALYTSTSSEDGESADAASAVGVNPCFAVNEPSISWVEQVGLHSVQRKLLVALLNVLMVTPCRRGMYRGFSWIYHTKCSIQQFWVPSKCSLWALSP